MKADVLIVDGRHLLWRSCDAFKELYVELENGEEVGTGGMYGFLCVLLRVHARYGGRVMVAWEGNRQNNFRLGLYKAYKKKDEERSEEDIELQQEMGEQERRLMALLRLLGVPQYEADGFEADDVIATLATKASRRGLRVAIYSGDGDLRQLVDENVFTISPAYKGQGPDKIYATTDDVGLKDGVGPRLIPDMKALAGDSSDNIPGVRGIGQATAVKAIRACGPLEKVLRAAKSGDAIGIPERFRQKLQDAEPELVMFKKLTTVVRDADLQLITPKRDPKRVRMHFMAYKFRSLTDPVEWMNLMRLSGEREAEKT